MWAFIANSFSGQSRYICRPKQFNCRPRPAAQLLTICPGALCYSDGKVLRIGRNIGSGHEGRQKTALERGTNPKRSRRSCIRWYGLQPRGGSWARADSHCKLIKGAAGAGGGVQVMGMMGAEVTWEENAVTVKGTGGKLKGVDLSMIKMPDAAMTLAVAALFADGPTTIRDVARYFHSLSLAQGVGLVHDQNARRRDDAGGGGAVRGRAHHHPRRSQVLSLPLSRSRGWTCP
jgi:hypothetical protein